MIPDQNSPTRNATLRNIRKLSAVIAISAAAISMTGCESMSDATKDQGKIAICAAGNEIAAQIRTGGAVGKFAAGVVRDNTNGEIRDLAEKVASGQNDEEAAKELAGYVDKLCNK